MDFRTNVLGCLGRFPDKTDLSPSIISSSDKGDHIMQRVSYCVEENERIISYLLIPKKMKVKKPAVLALHQHNGEYFLGKSEPAGLSKNAMYHYGLELCRRGYIVLCPDHLGFEDRRLEEFKRMEDQSLEGSNYEKLLFCRYLANGSSLQAKYIFDLSRGVDFLQTLDFVDADRIGAIGHSLGGQEVLWLTWYDQRIKAAVSSCGFGQLRSIIRDCINHNFALFCSGFLDVGDMSDLVCDIAPRPFMMTNGSSDRLFPLDGVDDICDAAIKAYSENNALSNFRSIVFQGDHSFPEEIREEAYNWLDKFLIHPLYE